MTGCEDTAESLGDTGGEVVRKDTYLVRVYTHSVRYYYN